MSLENPDRIIVDVDVGLDDAAALFLLLHADTSGKIKIEAITCVNGNTNLDNVITNVLRLLELANRTDVRFIFISFVIRYLVLILSFFLFTFIIT